MAKPFVDYSGKVFGSWTVISFHGYGTQKHQIWICKCQCGTIKPVFIGSLRSGRSFSCGCLAISRRIPQLLRHGMAGTPSYKSWHQMHQRCLGKGGHDRYVLKKITVCERWASFENFYNDMGDRPPNMTLDRIDNSKGYFPENCRWASRKTQSNNRDVSLKSVVFGELLTPSEAARKHGKHISGIRHRLRKGWTLEQAILVPSMFPTRKRSSTRQRANDAPKA